MTKLHQPFISVLLLLLGVHLSAQVKEPVSIESLLHEMVDRESVARFPEPNFRLKQQSSFNRAIEDPRGACGMVHES